MELRKPLSTDEDACHLKSSHPENKSCYLVRYVSRFGVQWKARHFVFVSMLETKVTIPGKPHYSQLE
jgi:hypothetical protein